MFVILQDIQVLSKPQNDMLVKLGYVPAMIMRYTAHLQEFADDRDDDFIEEEKNRIQGVLRDEIPFGDKYHNVRIRSLAMISLGKTININKMGWTAARFSWTCLKTEELHLKEVCAVSNLVREAVVAYTSSSPTYLLDVVSMDFLLWRTNPGGPPY
jgi:hypothetical protein